MGQTRDYRLDGLKYSLICLVVLCHLMQGCRYNGSFFQAFYSVVYSFHMPLFVFLSGYFFKASTCKKVHSGNMKLMEPLLVWHFLILFFYDLFVLHEFDIKKFFIFEPSPLWYLVSLLCWRWMTLGIEKVLDNVELEIGGGGKKLLFILLSILISILAFNHINAIYGCYFSIMRTFQFFPFFVLGHCLTRHQMEGIQKKPFVIVFSTLSIVLIVLICHFAGSDYNAIVFSKYGLKDLQGILEMSKWATFEVRMFVYFISLSLCLSILSVYRCPIWLSNNGNTTLFILCTHVVLYYIVRNINVGLIAFIVAVLSILLLTGLAKTNASQWLLYPFSSINSLFKN